MIEAIVGALPRGSEGAVFRVWTPKWRHVEVVLEDGAGAGTVQRLEPGRGGWHSGVVERAAAGSLYRYRLDDDSLVPDPASRYQPEGPHGPSEVIDPSVFPWRDSAWRGRGLRGQVLYEMHVGTFSREGDWQGAMAKLPDLARIGITTIELMPVADFPGRFGWGYDGVAPFAPYHGYGRPDDMRAFVDRAHGLGMGVVLDVVYNHLGPDGNYLPQLAPEFFSRSRKTDWGDAINFDERHSEHVRAFVLANVRHWIEEYHLDGFRVDATQDVHDDSEPHILAEIAREARAAAAGRDVLLIAENEPQQVRVVTPEERGGYGFDAMWNDDLHHSATAALTGLRGAYYSDYRGTAQELVSAAKHGFLYQGQHYAWQSKRRGSPTHGFPPACFIAYLENHDQLANSEAGLRLLTRSHSGCYRALLAYLLLSPSTPMLFQGQEYGATTPFLFFADHRGELAASVRKGRADFLSQFPNLALESVQARLPDPADPSTFERSRLSDEERARHLEWLALCTDLLRLRREDAAFRIQEEGVVDGAVLANDCFLLRYRMEKDMDDRLLLVNLAPDLELQPMPEPLLAPPADCDWRLLWTSEAPSYGGRGTPEPECGDGWRIQGHAAALLQPVARRRAASRGGRA